MRHVINYSGGLCSFWAARRVVERHGPDDVTLLFADTLIEDSDLYRFNQETSEYLGVPITRVSREKTPWQLFREQGAIGNTRIPICSIELKRKPLWQWMNANLFGSFDSIIYMGFDWTEAHRLDEIRKEHWQWRIEAPMTEEPIWDKCRMVEELSAIGIALPRAYREGFPHNNCGRRCVRAGISHFVHLLKVDPTAYGEWEDEEEKTIAEFNARQLSSASYSILRDRRNGSTSPLTLKELRLRVESGESMPKHEWGGCGCS